MICYLFRCYSDVILTFLLRFANIALIYSFSPQVPSSPASIQMIPSWAKSLLDICGVEDTPGSTRAAVANISISQGQSLDLVLQRGIWRAAATVINFYFRPS